MAHGHEIESAAVEQNQRKAERKRGGGMAKHGKVAEKKKNEMAHHARKHGGHVPGNNAKSRPDKRDRGGATSDKNPMTTAAKMSDMPYTRAQQPTDEHGMGGDRD